MRALPNELLLEIFEHLSYFDLLRTLSSCKRFQSIITTAPSLSTTLFRDVLPSSSTTNPATIEDLGPPTPEGASRWWVLCGRIKFPRVRLGNGLSFRAPPTSTVERFEGKVHPAFKELEYGLEDDVEGCFFGLPPLSAGTTTTASSCQDGSKSSSSNSTASGKDGVVEVGGEELEYRKLRLIDTPVRHENAITPPVSKLVLHVGWYPEFWLLPSSSSSTSVITVEDIMRGVVAAYNTLVSESDWQNVRDDVFDDGWSSDDEESTSRTAEEKEKKEEEVKKSMLGRPRKEFLRSKEMYGFWGVREGMFIDEVLHVFVPHERCRKRRRWRVGKGVKDVVDEDDDEDEDEDEE